ncbi:MAG: RnfABCDGE type electron transport complex subunit G [Acetobacterium sp.]|nr:RnfABCDGE type electron transport complex subunit G [Bacillota bacterium]MCG2730149.1 RnfABCDGE type electron transport complex subunit G [Acetobacterium sp.]
MEKLENKAKIDWKNVFKLGFILFAISAVAACALALTNYVTAGTIAKLNLETNRIARQQVLPEATDFEAVPVERLAEMASEIGLKNPEELREAYIGKNDSDIVGYTVKTGPTSGYSGEIQVLTGISKDGKVTGITIIKHNETPGLGALATQPKFKDQYKGLSALEKITVVKTIPEAGSNAIQAITGATITSKAVTDGVNLSNEVYQNLLN